MVVLFFPTTDPFVLSSILVRKGKAIALVMNEVGITRLDAFSLIFRTHTPRTSPPNILIAFSPQDHRTFQLLGDQTNRQGFSIDEMKEGTHSNLHFTSGGLARSSKMQEEKRKPPDGRGE